MSASTRNPHNPCLENVFSKHQKPPIYKTLAVYNDKLFLPFYRFAKSIKTNMIYKFIQNKKLKTLHTILTHDNKGLSEDLTAQSSNH